MLYLDLFRSLAAHDIPHLLVGGLAVNLRGVPRLTMDVDLAIKYTRKPIGGLEEICRELSLTPIQPVTLHQLGDSKERERIRGEKNLAAFSLRLAVASDPTVDLVLETVWDFDSAWRRKVGGPRDRRSAHQSCLDAGPDCDEARPGKAPGSGGCRTPAEIP